MNENLQTNIDEISNGVKNLINGAKNICIIPSQHEPESLTAALALFYTLRELNKNVNLIVEEIPEKLHFLIPSLDFISSPKNFVISIPRSLADVSQIYYEKNEEHVKIHVTVEKGQIKKEGISFYFQDPKPDLIITLGIQDFQKQLQKSLDSFGFLLDSPIVNIDSEPHNLKFGKINAITQTSISQATLEIIKCINEELVKKNSANCILAGLMTHYEHFQSSKTNPEVFEIAAYLIKKGADNQYVASNLAKTSPKEVLFLSSILKNFTTQDQVSVATLDVSDFERFAENEARATIEKLQSIGMGDDTLVLWKSHASSPMIKGFFNSKKANSINKFAQDTRAKIKNGWVFLEFPGEDIHASKNETLKLLHNVT